MMELLDSMEEYDWHTRILNTKDFGVPQNRPRLYIVGIRRIHAKKAFVWPSPMADSPQLDEFLDPVAQPRNGDDLVSSLPTADVKRRKILGAIENLMNQNLNPLTTAAVCSADNRVATTMVNRTPCLTRSRAATKGHWLLHRGRQMSTREIFKLQGLNPDRWACPAAMSESHFRACAGNAMSGNVIKAVLLSVLTALDEI